MATEPIAAIGAMIRRGAYDEYANAPAVIAAPDRHHGHALEAGAETRLDVGDVDPEDVGDGQTAADPGDDARGGEQRLGQPGTGRQVEARERILEPAHEADPGQQHDDVRGDHERRVELQRRGLGPGGEQRGDGAAGHLLVEERQPAPVHHQLEPVDAHRRRERDRGHPGVAAEHQADARAHHAPAQGDRPARPAVAGRHDPGQGLAGLGQVRAAVDHVAHQVVHQGEVLVVDLALRDLPHLEHDRLLGVRLEAHRHRRERDVDVGVPDSQRPAQGAHRRGHVGRPGARGQQELTDPEAEVQRQVQGPCVEHGAMLTGTPWVTAARVRRCGSLAACGSTSIRLPGRPSASSGSLRSWTRRRRDLVNRGAELIEAAGTAGPRPHPAAPRAAHQHHRARHRRVRHRRAGGGRAADHRSASCCRSPTTWESTCSAPARTRSPRGPPRCSARDTATRS